MLLPWVGLFFACSTVLWNRRTSAEFSFATRHTLQCLEPFFLSCDVVSGVVVWFRVAGEGFFFLSFGRLRGEGWVSGRGDGRVHVHGSGSMGVTTYEGGLA